METISSCAWCMRGHTVINGTREKKNLLGEVNRVCAFASCPLVFHVNYIDNYIKMYSWNSTGKIGRIGRHRAEKPNVEVTMCFGPMPSDASDFPGGIPA